MIEVPQHCIDRFKEKFKFHPSIIEFDYDDISSFEKLTSRSYSLWFTSVLNQNSVDFIEKHIEYDPTGIHFYTKKLDEKKLKIFIMTTPDKVGVAEFTINNLLKAKKNGN